MFLEAGDTETEESVAFVTVKFTDVLTEPRVAVMMVIPVVASG